MNKSGAYAWLAAGAVVAGLGVAGMDCAAVASADIGTSVASSGVTQPAATGASATKRSAISARKSGSAAAVASAATRASRPNDLRPVSQARASLIARAGAKSVTLDPLQTLTRQVQYIFNNTAPTIQAGTQAQGAGGTVAGTVTGQSNNGFALAYSLGVQPQYGIAAVNPVTGAYTYAPNATVPVVATVDQFTIVANNGTAAQVPGLLGFAQSLLHALAMGIGMSSGDTADADIAVSLTGQTVIGNPVAKEQYWQEAKPQTAALAAVSMVIGQLSGNKPEWDGLITQAEITDSVVKTVPKTAAQKQTGEPVSPVKMYIPGSKVEGEDWIFNADANELLQKRGYVVTVTYYSKSGGLDEALGNLAISLFMGESVIVYPRTDSNNVLNVGYVVTVLGLDFTKQQVYLNDGSRSEAVGKGRTLTLSEFISVWGPTYETVVVKKAAASV